MAKPQVTYRIEARVDELCEIRGSFTSGDEEADEKLVQEIYKRLDENDVWAWCEVTVIAECEGFKGYDHLGGCCYKNEDDFKSPGGYYEQMKDEALADLRRKLEEAVTKGSNASDLLKRMGGK